MIELNLKKLIRKKETVKVIEEITGALNTSIFILDAEGELLLGIEAGNGNDRYPVTVEGETIGWVVGDEKCKVLASFLTYAANSEYEKRRLADETLEKYREISLLYNVSEKINTCLDPKEVANLAVEEAARLINSTSGSVMVFNRDNGMLEKILSRNGRNNELEAPECVKGIIKSVIDRGTAEIVNDVSSDNRSTGADKKVSSIICAPLRVKDRTIGVIELENSNPVNYSSEDLKLLSAIATQAAIAIENANLYDTLRETFFETVQALVETIEKKDPYTAGHARRVAQYSVAIGEAMGLPRSEITVIKLAALLHDIGKIGVEDSILLKDGKLTDDEYAVIKKHSVFGAEIIGNINQLKNIVPCVRGHHERFDGRGYPDGLREENIPLISRILAVADTFDAMTSNRPYRRELEKEFALKEIERNIKTQFDPEVVRVFIETYTGNA